MSATPGTRARATIRDVAALAGVGIKTVSRVINDEANVSPSTRERVQDAVVALNFKPHLGAGALRRSGHKTWTLGLLLDSVANPFSASVNRAVEVVATARGTAVFAASSDDDVEQERALVEAFSRRRVDGLILTTISADHAYLAPEQQQGTPLVFIDRPPVGLSADAVLTDNYEAAERATRHLLAAGHRRIAHLGDELAISTARERLAGYTAALTAVGSRPISVNGLPSESAAEAAAYALLTSAEPPTALFTSQNLVTMGAVRALHALGLEHEVALISFDDLPLADLLQPGVSVVAQNPSRIGTLAAERIFARLDGDDGAAQTLVVPSVLIPRGSGEIPLRSLDRS